MGAHTALARWPTPASDVSALRRAGRAAIIAAMTDHNFRDAFVARLRRDWRTEQKGNIDHYRFPPEMVAAAPKWRHYARSIGGERVRSVWRAVRTIARSRDLQWMHDHLADDTSRELLIDVLVFRSLGSRRVRLPLNGPRYWDAAAAIERDLRVACGSHRLPSGEILDDYDLNVAGIPVQLRGHLLNVLNAFSLQQYRFERDGVVVEAEPGDTVIDAGGCWGDTALYFAWRTGPEGRVWSYEFDPSNLQVFAHNLARNPGLAERVRIVRRPIWSCEEIQLDVAGSGPNTRLIPAQGDCGTLATDSIDALVAREGLQRVNFIKMDIEGAEFEALKGAEAAIRRHRPKLAISIYHRLEHFWEIARWIDNLDLGYRFHIEHFTIHAEETMLFATAARYRDTRQQS